jgi:hypothetical protein
MVKAITIKTPKANTPHPWGTKVRGRVWDGCGPREAVQLMVLAADKKWYPQPHVHRSGSHFHGKAYLGWQVNPNAKVYTIAAGVGGALVKDVVTDLPSDVLWATVKVGRI